MPKPKKRRLHTVAHELAGGETGLVKVLFKLKPDPEHTYESETVWARTVGRGLYLVENTPFLVYGISYHDVVKAKERDGILQFTSVAKRGGHSTYRVFFDQGIEASDGRVIRGVERLNAVGCPVEWAGTKWFAVDVPNDADIDAAYEVLQEIEDAGVWGFEEGHCGHKVN